MRFVVAMLLGVSAAGCDPVATIHGRVVRAPDVAADGRAFGDGIPIANAHMTVKCPSMFTEGPYATDASGRTGLALVGFWSDACTVELSAEGYEDQVIPFEKLCPTGLQSCSRVAFQAELAPKPGAAPQPQEPAKIAEKVPVHFFSARHDLTVFALAEEVSSRHAFTAGAWERVCDSPCDALLPVDARLGVAPGDGSPVEPSDKVSLLRDARFAVRYEDWRTPRLITTIFVETTVVAGVVMLAAGAPGDNQPWRTNNIVLVSSGAGALLGAALGVGLLSLMPPPESAHITPF